MLAPDRSRSLSLPSLSLDSPSLSRSFPVLLTLLAKSYLKPEYLSLGFFQSVTFSSTAATTCELVRRIVDFIVGFGGKDNLAAERLDLAMPEAIAVVGAHLREDAMLVHRLIAKIKRRKNGTTGWERTKGTMLQHFVR